MQEVDQDIIREFLVESHQNLSRLDRELVELEQRPKDAALLGSIFRTIHTLKGTCGFLGFANLERIAHQVEDVLSQLRDGQRELTSSLVSIILEAVDTFRKILASIEACGEEGSERFEDVAGRLRAAARQGSDAAAEPELDAEPPHPQSTDAVKRLAAALQLSAEREEPTLNAAMQRLNSIARELQEGVMKTRTQPIGMLWNRLPRVVRAMAVALGKQIELKMEGTETELDRTIVEAIKDPLMHLVRNSCGHGIEAPEVRQRAGKPPQGTLALRAYCEGGQVNIEIADDGVGIDVARVKWIAVEKGLLRPEQAEKLSDREAIRLIFQPGFSTAKTVTNVSGRGVGMDVVKSNIEKIGGVVDIFSRLGEGVTVKLKIPLTLAIVPGPPIAGGGERFVIPQGGLLELARKTGIAKARERLDGSCKIKGRLPA